jgi:hypothetical protein
VVVAREPLEETLLVQIRQTTTGLGMVEVENFLELLDSLFSMLLAAAEVLTHPGQSLLEALAAAAAVVWGPLVAQLRGLARAEAVVEETPLAEQNLMAVTDRQDEL